MKLATTTSDFLDYTQSQTDSLAYIREAGFRYADYSFHYDYITHSGIFSSDPNAHLEAVARTADSLGIRLVQAHAPMGDPISEDNTAFASDTVRCVEACGRWGIPNLVVHSGYLEGLTRDETLLENKKFFDEILAAAEKYGTNILVENFNKRCIDGIWWIDNATDLKAQIDLVDHPLFHAVWDVGHANMQDMPQSEELGILGTQVRALHIQDNTGERDSHLLPFLGTMNMDDVMHGLLSVGYDGYFTFEVGRIFTRTEHRRPYPQDTRLASTPLAIKRAAERLLYETGKCILEAYDVFEE